MPDDLKAACKIGIQNEPSGLVGAAALLRESAALAAQRQPFISSGEAPLRPADATAALSRRGRCTEMAANLRVERVQGKGQLPGVARLRRGGGGVRRDVLARWIPRGASERAHQIVAGAVPVPSFVCLSDQGAKL